MPHARLQGLSTDPTEEILPQKSLARYACHDETLMDGLGKHFWENI